MNYTFWGDQTTQMYGKFGGFPLNVALFGLVIHNDPCMMVKETMRMQLCKVKSSFTMLIRFAKLGILYLPSHFLLLHLSHELSAKGSPARNSWSVIPANGQDMNTGILQMQLRVQ